jgi:hypothetical protein
MWRPEGEDDVDSLATLYALTYSSSVIVTGFSSARVATGVASVCSTLTVSGRRSGSKVVGSNPFNKALEEEESPFLPIKVASGPEPNGVFSA